VHCCPAANERIYVGEAASWETPEMLLILNLNNALSNLRGLRKKSMEGVDLSSRPRPDAAPMQNHVTRQRDGLRRLVLHAATFIGENKSQ
jgi:hypothetical protein